MLAQRTSLALCAALLLAPTASVADVDAKVLMEQYLKADWREQTELRSKIVEEGAKVAPLAVARLRSEAFTRAAAQSEKHWPDRNGADLLQTLAGAEDHRKRVVGLVKPLLESRNANERGWANRILGGPVYFDGELEPIPGLLEAESVDDIRWAILERLYYRLSNDPDSREKKSTASSWRRRLVVALGACLASKDEWVVRASSKCLREIPSRESTAVAVQAIARDPGLCLPLIGLLRQRIGFRHPAALTREEQTAVVGVLIRTKMEDPNAGDDRLTDIIKDIPDRRVLPAFFEMLEKHKDNARLQRQASYCIWILFTDDLRKETPREIYDMQDLNKDPMRAGELWRRWYKEHGDRLSWDESSAGYALKPDDEQRLQASAVRDGLEKTKYPKGSVIQYCHIPAGTRWKPSPMNKKTGTPFSEDGYLVLIDEQPTYDLAHSFQVLFVPSGSPRGARVLFHGDMFPTFDLTGKDGKPVRGWKRL